MPIYKKPNGTYQLYWRKGNQNVYKTFDKKSSANLYEKKLIEKLMKLQTLFMDNYKCWKSIIVDGEYYKKGDVNYLLSYLEMIEDVVYENHKIGKNLD